jgi:predicted glycoside hydrolase/deacetylase ChbG (UPF0249 family)
MTNASPEGQKASREVSNGSGNAGNIQGPGTGLLIINADDWGLDHLTTDRILDCALRQRLSSVSAMVFMEDSERAAAIGREEGINAGLHLNLSARFCAKSCSSELLERQRMVIAVLRRHRYSRALLHPGLRRHLDYVVAAQLEEFQRLYGGPPARIDGHHHMHLCPDVLLAGLLPQGTKVRRSFSFSTSDKGPFNRFYRSLVDRILARRHILTDYFFALAPLEPSTRLTHILSLATTFTVELETHPALTDEYNWLLSDRMLRLLGDVRLALPR